jgi:hypothetical protein
MDELRLGDVIDDHCIKCRRLTNHSIVSMIDGQAAKVRCLSCYHEHTYLHEQAPPSKKDLKKAELFNAVLAGSGVPAEPAAEEPPAAEEAPAPEPKTNRTRAKKV